MALSSFIMKSLFQAFKSHTNIPHSIENSNIYSKKNYKADSYLPLPSSKKHNKSTSPIEAPAKCAFPAAHLDYRLHSHTASYIKWD
jgi:hypothetical protein